MKLVVTDGVNTPAKGSRSYPALLQGTYTKAVFLALSHDKGVIIKPAENHVTNPLYNVTGSLIDNMDFESKGSYKVYKEPVTMQMVEG